MTVQSMTTAQDDDIELCLRGAKLYGDDFDENEATAWFRDEADAYFNLSERGHERGEYEYHSLNKLHGYRYLPQGRVLDVLGFGSAYGYELEPILGACHSITIADIAAGFASKTLFGRPVRFVRPNQDGTLPFSDASFDLVTAFSVLHHVPTVTRVIREFHRCLRPGGYALLREPTVSMGDWRKPRSGLTKRERGIPLGVFREIIQTCGFTVLHEQRCVFALTSRMQKLIRRPVFSLESVAWLDARLCRLPIWSRRYHAERLWHKLRPTAVAYVLTKE